MLPVGHLHKNFALDSTLDSIQRTVNIEKSNAIVMGTVSGFVVGTTVGFSLPFFLLLAGFAAFGLAGTLLLPIPFLILGVGIGTLIGYVIQKAWRCDRVAQSIFLLKQEHEKKEITGKQLADLVVTLSNGGHKTEVAHLFKAMNRRNKLETINELPLNYFSKVQISGDDNIGMARFFFEHNFKRMVPDEFRNMAIDDGMEDFRVCYEIWMRKQKKPIDENILAIEFHNFVGNQNNRKAINIRFYDQANANKGSIIDLTKLIAHTRSEEFKEKLSQNQEGAQIPMDKIKGIDDFIEFLNGKYDISKKEQLENIAEWAQMFEFQDLINDLKEILPNRPDLLHDADEMRQFMQRYDKFANMRIN